jgi:hypothetical protein
MCHISFQGLELFPKTLARELGDARAMHVGLLKEGLLSSLMKEDEGM